jgi:hypothetical protein
MEENTMLEELKNIMMCQDVVENPLPGFVRKEFVVTYSNGRQDLVTCKPRKNGGVDRRTLTIESL